MESEGAHHVNRPPLAGYRVLDLAHLLPGELATMWLAFLGADVIKVEAPHLAGSLLMPRDRSNPYRAALNRGKRSVTINLKHPEGQALLHRLVSTADILVEGFRPGVMARLGADYETLRNINPRLIYCSITGYGQEGPYARRPGHDNNYLALAGLLARNVGDDGQPHLLPVQLADVGGGTLPALVAILAALIARETTGQGQHLDVSMLDGALAWTYLLLPLSRFPQLDALGVGMGLLTGEAPCYNVYETADGRYLALGALEPKFWKRVCDVLERPDLKEHAFDPSVLSEVRSLFKTQPLEVWLSRFNPEEIPVTPLLSLDEMSKDPHIQARGSLAVDDRGIPYARFPVRFSGTPLADPSSPPGLGDHTGEILRRELGLSDDEVRRLRTAGAIG